MDAAPNQTNASGGRDARDTAPVAQPASPVSDGPGRELIPRQTIAWNPEKITLLTRCVQLLRGAMTQGLLYAQGTKQFERALDTLHQGLTELIAAIGEFKLGTSEGMLLINDERVDRPAWLRGHLESLERMLKASFVGSITFQPMLTKEELGSVLHMVAHRKLPETESAKLHEILHEQGVTHIRLERVRYLRARDRERVVATDDSVIRAHAVAQRNISELVNATIKVIDQVGDKEAQTQLRAELSDQLIEKDAGMLDSLLASTGQRMRSHVSEARLTFSTVPIRDGAILQEALQIAALLRDKNTAFDDPVLCGVKSLIARLVAPYQTHVEDILGVVKLDEAQMSLMPEWLVEAFASLHGRTAAERVAGLLCTSPGALLVEQTYAQIVDVLDELSVAGMDEQSAQLAGHVAGALRSSTKSDRMKAVERLAFLADRSLEQMSAAVRTIEDALLEESEHETCDEVHKVLMDSFIKRITCHYALGNFPRARAHFDQIMNLEDNARQALKDEGANIARRARETLAKSEFAGGLSADLLVSGDKADTATYLLTKLGSGAWDKIVERVRVMDAIPQAERILALLKNIHPGAMQSFYAALGREADGPIALRMLKLAQAHESDSELWPQIAALLRHADPAVREEALAMAVRKDGELGIGTISAALQKDDDPERRRIWLGALARMLDPHGREMVLSELEHALSVPDADSDTVIMLLETLNSVKDATLIPFAIGLIQAQPRRARPVILAALRALAPFYTRPEVATALEEARREKDPEISRLALVCLRGIVAASQAAVESAPAPQPENARAVAAEAPPPRPRTARRWFEDPTSKADSAFKAGAAIGSGKSSPAALTSLAPVHESAKPMLEGQMEKLSLQTLLNMVCNRDGTLRITYPETDAVVHIRDKQIVSAKLGDKLDMHALLSMSTQRGVHFAYYTDVPVERGAIKLDVARFSEVMQALLQERA